MVTGKLIVINNRTLRVQFTNAKGKDVTFNIKESELSAFIAQKKKSAIAQLNGLEVELEEVGGQPKQIREKGKAFEALESVRTSSNSSATTPVGDFHNPYNFVPALPHNTDIVQNSELGDRTPCSHGSYLDRYWSGRISVTLTTVTPLLIPDAANAREVEGTNGHKSYPIRLVNGKPYLPATSIKGMLRSAYETVTNSRFSVFEKHEDRLAYRMPVKNSDIFPARVERRDDNLVLRILTTGLVGHAGKLPRYQQSSNRLDKGESEAAVKYNDSSLPQHGDAVWIRLNQGVVTRIRKWTPICPGGGEWLKGWVLVTGANINGKKYERVFVESSDNQDIITVTNEMKSLWQELIKNYQETHVKDLEQRRRNNQQPQEYLGNEPGRTGWSRHIYEASELELKEGTLCYVELSNNQVTGLFPVSISRRLYTVSPQELLDTTLQPATDINHLSPAERVFGWVNQNGNGSYKGNLRVSVVQCDSDDPVEEFTESSLPLAILGQPKPQQARFYIAKDDQGTPLDPGLAKQDGYRSNYSLRGRKVYPHHAKLPAQHWENPTEDRTQTDQAGHFQEYRRPKINGQEQRDDQNRSIQAWVKPNVSFSFDIDVTNLSDVELGALLWLLSLPEHYYHRLGGGKPLGFGSVKLEINWDKTDLRKGEAWRKFYFCLDSTPNLSPKEAQTSIKVFQDTVTQVYGKPFDEVGFIQAFCRCVQGFDDNKPIHYPRKRQQSGQNLVPPHPEGKAFEWFVENERTGNSGGPKVSLPNLVSDYGLPLLP
ncbi:TIGR03986 family type III CRISPR-associated RAMP protein [Scytonema sp. PRP1]|uniref:TIGR03986 family type III CRISPR-associated RAMP protein n=1 Tax=Scytonema sp. PRP1 TaxID=3120513 RepID=UPI002FD4A074